MANQPANETDTRWEIHEHAFRSDQRLIGGWIARFRSAWHSVAGKWADRAIIQQQNEYNRAIARQFAEVDQQSAELDQRLIYTDRDLIELTRTMGELTQQLIQLQRALELQQPDRSSAGQDASPQS